jgi:uncharacterized damage-inducible protein DinB
MELTVVGDADEARLLGPEEHLQRNAAGLEAVDDPDAMSVGGRVPASWVGCNDAALGQLPDAVRCVAHQRRELIHGQVGSSAAGFIGLGHAGIVGPRVPAPDRRLTSMSIRRFYDRWPQYNRRLTEVVGAMTDEQLAIRSAPDRDPIWAVVGHTAAARTYWLCGVAREPGAATTPWPDPNGEGWEDDLDHPRGARELVGALDTTWDVVDGVLDRWTPEMLGDMIERRYGDTVQPHSRASILQRLLTHEAYHCGELSQTLGIHGLPQIDLWRPD